MTESLEALKRHAQQEVLDRLRASARKEAEAQKELDRDAMEIKERMRRKFGVELGDLTVSQFVRSGYRSSVLSGSGNWWTARSFECTLDGYRFTGVLLGKYRRFDGSDLSYTVEISHRSWENLEIEGLMNVLMGNYKPTFKERFLPFL